MADTQMHRARGGAPEMIAVRLPDLDEATHSGSGGGGGASGGKQRERKRRSRWGDESDKVAIAGLPTQLSSNLSGDQLRQYARVMRIEEITALLRQENLKAPDEPGAAAGGGGGAGDQEAEPQIFRREGRINTRDVRYRNKLEEERHVLVEDALREDPTYRPPVDYKRPGKTQDRLYIPATEFPEVNFIGLLIGPRGNTLKKMEADTGCKISIRGKGSVKEGKGTRNGYPQPHEEDELHALISADSAEKVLAGVQLINSIIEESCSIPEGQNELKRRQLRELAQLNGTLRDDEGQLCPNCGNAGHRRFECPERTNVTNTTFCRICGGVGHMASDCLEKNNPDALRKAQERNQQTDTDYNRLMRELDGDASSAAGGMASAAAAAPAANQPPWHRSVTATPTVTTSITPTTYSVQQMMQPPQQMHHQAYGQPPQHHYQQQQQWMPQPGGYGYPDPNAAYGAAAGGYVDPYAAAAWASQAWIQQQQQQQGEQQPSDEQAAPQQ